MIATELNPGDVLDGFCITSRFHAGGMAVIYEVVHEGLPGPAVMKVPRLGQGESSAGIVGFEVEQMMLDALSGGPVPMLYASSDIEREPYIVMEKVLGKVLAEEVERAPWPVEEVARVGAALADALAALHAMGAIHLDLKPSNAILCPQGHVVLIDLGLARHSHLPDLLAEAFQRPLGSAPYIAPEQVLGVRNDPRSDLFALGVMLYEFSTGVLPFGWPQSPNGMRKRLKVAPHPPRALRPELPAALQEVILHCLEVYPNKRYANAQQVAFDLRHLDQVEISERGENTKRVSLTARMRDWIRGSGYEPETAEAHDWGAESGSIVLIVVALGEGDDRQQQALQREVERMGEHMPEARLAFVATTRLPPVLGTSDEATSAPREHIRMLIELRHWAGGLHKASSRVTHQVLEDNDPAEAILNYARTNRVSHILIGAPAESGRKFLAPHVGKIVLSAPCSVTVVHA